MLKNTLRIIFPTIIFAVHQSVFGAGPPPFTVHNITTPFKVSHPVVVANISPASGSELLVLGVDELGQRSVAVYGLNAPTNKLTLLDNISVPNSIFAIDVGEVSTEGLQNLFLLSKNMIYKYVPGQLSQEAHLVEEQSVSSMYLGNFADAISSRDFARDINDDGKDDFVIPHFEQLNLWLSDCCSQRHYQSLPIAAQLKVDKDSVTFGETQLYYADLTLDGKTDVVLVEQGKLIIYPQKQDTQFATQALQVNINKTIHGVNWWDIVEADGQNMDQSELTHRKVENIQDMNGDNIADIAVRFTKSSGVLDRVNDYQFFFGSVINKQLTYPEQPDTAIISDETLSDLQLIDLDADGKQEVMLSSFDLGLSQIIGALLSGSIEQDALIFSMDENNKFIKKPLVNQEVEITFSLSSGRSGEPLLKVADVNGDKFKDLVFSDDDDQIHVLFATPKGKRAFAKRPVKQKLKVPKNAENAAQSDLNNDGKADFILHYGRLDESDMLAQLTVLIAN
ncbi:MAG: hypothetical protein ACI88A_001316 [Paraglaciecola sp.]|jgi:hypothetical protein